MSNQIHEAENPQRIKAPTTVQIHRIQLHTSRNGIRGGGGGIPSKPRRHQTPVLKLIVIGSASRQTPSFDITTPSVGLWQFSAILWHILTLE